MQVTKHQKCIVRELGHVVVGDPEADRFQREPARADPGENSMRTTTRVMVDGDGDERTGGQEGA